MGALPSRDRLVDLAAAGVFVAAGQVGLHLDDGSGFTGSAGPVLTAVLVAAIALPLVVRRRYPIGALVGVAVAIVVPRAFASVALPLWGGLGTLVFALYSAARFARRPGDSLALAVPAVTLVALGLEIRGFAAWGEYVFSVPVVLLGWLTGQAVRRWHRTSQVLRGHLADLAETERARAAAAVADERARIARELHDVVAHSVSVMVVQAGSARLGMARDPEGSADALRRVEETGRQALVEMRHMLGLLRSDGAGPALSPQPTLRALPSLVASARAAGQPVELQVEGAPASLPPGLDLSAYRIVQEALTNAHRHAGPVPVTVQVCHGAGELVLEVTNGPPAPAAGRVSGAGADAAGPGGHGLIGMRERTELYGGTLGAGRTVDGGFSVRAVLPVPGRVPAAVPETRPGGVPA